MSSSRMILLFVLMAAAVVGLYWPSLHYKPFFDDIYLFERSGLNLIFQQGFAFEIRWLSYFTTAWVDLLFEDNILAQRGINVALHLATAFVLYTLIEQVSNRVAPHRNNQRAALAASLLFLLHPLAVYAVGYMIQRTILMATLFGLLALNTYFDGLVTRKKAYFLFSALFYLLSAFSKEHAVLIAAAALALTPLAVPISRQTLRQLVFPLSLFFLIAVLVVVKSQDNLGRVYEPFAAQLVRLHTGEESRFAIWGLSVMTQATLFFKYLGLMLIPYAGWMSIDMRVPLAAHFWEPKYLLGVLAFVMYGMMALFWLFKGGRRGMIGFALLAPLLLFAVEFSTVRIQEPFVLYRAYLWMPLLFLLVPAISCSVPDKLFWAVVLATAVAFSFSSRDRLASFSSEFALWDDAVQKLPDEQALGSARTYANRGYLNMKRGALQAAIADLSRALRVDPEYKKAYQDRAVVHMKLGNYPAALRDADLAIRLRPEDPNGYALRGVIYRSKGDFNKAMADFTFACKQKSVGACAAIKVTKGYSTGSTPRQ